MATTIKIGEEVTVGTTPVEYVINEDEAVLEKPTFTAAIYTSSANAGTIKFSVGVTPPAAQRAVAADKNVIVGGINNGVKNLWAVGSVADQKFTVG